MKQYGGEAPTIIQEAQERLPYVLQYKDRTTGEWKNFGKDLIRGKTAAYEMLNRKKRQHGESVAWRVVPKNEADKYREGIELGRRLSGGSRSGYRALIHLPERL